MLLDSYRRTSSVDGCLQLVGNKTKMCNLQAQHRHRPRMTRNSHHLGLARLLWGNRVSVCSLSMASMSRAGSREWGARSPRGCGLSAELHFLPLPPQPRGSVLRAACCAILGLLLAGAVIYRKSFLNVPHPESPNYGYKAETGVRSEDHSDVPQ